MNASDLVFGPGSKYKGSSEGEVPMPSFQRNGRLVLLALVLVLLCPHAPALASHELPLPSDVIVVDVALSDNGDGDGFADTNETVEMRLTVRRGSGGDLAPLIALLTTNDPKIECISVPAVEIGSLPAGEFVLTDPFIFKVANVDRATKFLGLGFQVGKIRHDQRTDESATVAVHDRLIDKRIAC